MCNKEYETHRVYLKRYFDLSMLLMLTKIARYQILVSKRAESIEQ